MEKTKQILIKKAKHDYYSSFLWLDIDKKELVEFIKEIKNTKTMKKLDALTYNLFNY